MLKKKIHLENDDCSMKNTKKIKYNLKFSRNLCTFKLFNFYIQNLK